MKNGKKIVGLLLLVFTLILGACVRIPNPQVLEIILAEGSIKENYIVGETLDLTKVQLSAKYADDKVMPIEMKQEYISGFSTEKPGKYTCTISFNLITVRKEYTVKEIHYEADPGVSYELVEATAGKVGETLGVTATKSVKIKANDILTADDISAFGRFNDFTYLDLTELSFAGNTIPTNLLNNSSTIQYIKLPDTVTVVSEGAFKGLVNLKAVYLGRRVNEIKGNPMIDCPLLENVRVNEANESFITINGVLHNKDATLLISYPANKSGETFTPISSLTKIGSYAFSANKHLKSLVIGGKVSVLEANAFNGAIGLTTVEIIDGLSQIGESAFSNCTALESVNMKNTVSIIGERAFSGCSALIAINFSANVRTLENNLIDGCSSLKKVLITNTVNTIKPQAFVGASSLESFEVSSANGNFSHSDGVLYSFDKKTLIYYPQGKINETASFAITDGTTIVKAGAFNGTKLKTILLPDSVTRIENNAFVGNSQLLGFSVSQSNSSFKDVGGVLFDKSGQKLVRYPDNKVEPNDTFKIPSTVQSIDPYAFGGNLKIQTLVLGEQVREIYPFILANMRAIKTITLHSNFVGFKQEALSGSHTLERIILDSLSVNFEKEALKGFNGAIDIVAKTSISSSFYGYYDSDELNASPILNCVKYDNIPKKLTADMVATSAKKLFTRYGDYEISMNVGKKPNVSEKFGYYVTTNDGEVAEFINAIIFNYQMKVERLDGQLMTYDLTKEIIGNLIGTDVANDNYIITIKRERFEQTIKVKLKDRQTFKVVYKVSENAPIDCNMQYVLSNGAVHSGQRIITLDSVIEGKKDLESVTATPEPKWLFDNFTFTVGENVSEYYDPLLIVDDYNGNLTPIIVGNTIHFENILCDIVVTVNFLPELDMSLSRGQFVESHEKIGGELLYGSDIISESAIKSIKSGKGFDLLISAEPYLLYPGIYGTNVDDVTGYRFKEWQFRDNSGNLMTATKDGDVYILTAGTEKDPLYIKYKVIETVENGELVRSSIEIISCQFDFALKAIFIPYFTLAYEAGEGGKIVQINDDNSASGESAKIVQKITYGENAKKILARINKKYMFVGWSDDVSSVEHISSQERFDKNITSPATYTANFKSLLPVEYIDIKSIADFEKMRENPAGNFRLLNNINFNGALWTPIGTLISPFRGMFDGNGFTLSNLKIVDQQFSGFFGNFSGDVRNLVMDKVSVECALKSEIFAGIIAGYMQDGSISNCTVTNSKIDISNAGKACVGGVVGMIHEGIVANCVVQIPDFTVGGQENVFVGGAVGQIDLGEVFNNLVMTRPYMKRSKGTSSVVGAIVGRSSLNADLSVRYNYYDANEIANMSEKTGYIKPVGSIGSGIHKLNYGKKTDELQNGTLPNSSWSEYVWKVENGKYPFIDAEVGVIEIKTAKDLMMIFSYPTGKFRLANDIILTDNWVPISYFAGELDGNEYVIYNVNIIDTKNISYINSGFFAKLGSGSIVSDLGFKDIYIESRAPNANVGGLVGTQAGGLIFGVYATGTIAVYGTTNTNVGGIVGTSKRASIIHNTYAVMDITSENGDSGSMGGVVGLVPQEVDTNVNIQFSYSMSTISAKGNIGRYNLGGLIGKNDSKSSIIKSNFYLRTILSAIDESYLRPSSIMTGNLVGNSEGDIVDNHDLDFSDMPSKNTAPSAPFDKWDRGIWSFSEKGNLNPTLFFETDIFNPESGEGTPTKPFAIDTYEELKWLKVYNNRNFILTKSIDMTGKEWSPFMFAGTLDGDGYSINGMTFTKAKKGGAALFSELGSSTSGAIISNLNLTNINIDITDANEDLKVGGIAMVSKAKSKIENCSVTGNISLNIPRGAMVGGLVAEAIGVGTERYRFNTTYVNMNLKSSADIVSTVYSGGISGAIIAGGVFGRTENVAMRYINSFGTINASGKLLEIGGIVGRTDAKTSSSPQGAKIVQANSNVNIIIDGRVNSSALVGGIVGRHYAGRLEITQSMIRGAAISVRNIEKPTIGDATKEIITLYLGGILGMLENNVLIGTYVVFNYNLYDGNIVIPYNEATDSELRNKVNAGIIIGSSSNDSRNDFTSHYGYRMSESSGNMTNIQAFGTIQGQIADNVIKRDRVTEKISYTMLNVTSGKDTTKEFINSAELSYGGKTLSSLYTYSVMYPVTNYMILVNPLHRVNISGNETPIWQEWLYVGDTYVAEKALFVNELGGRVYDKDSMNKPLLRGNSYVDISKAGIYVVDYRYQQDSENFYYAKQIVIVKDR